MGEKVWGLATTAAAISGGIVAKKVLETTWKFVTGGTTPDNPADPEVNWGEVIAFALVSGAVVQLTRVMVNHKSTQAHAKRTGQSPKTVAS